MKTALRTLGVACVVIALATASTRAAEGGYSNYIPGTCGDFGMASAGFGKGQISKRGEQ